MKSRLNTKAKKLKSDESKIAHEREQHRMEREKFVLEQDARTVEHSKLLAEEGAKKLTLTNNANALEKELEGSKTRVTELETVHD